MVLGSQCWYWAIASSVFGGKRLLELELRKLLRWAVVVVDCRGSCWGEVELRNGGNRSARGLE